MKLVIDIPEGLKDAFNHEEQWTALLCAEMRDVLNNGTPLPKGHGRLGDLDRLEREMYHKAFETDTDLQRWDSGCWIRYKMFEIAVATAPTIIEADGGEKDEET